MFLWFVVAILGAILAGLGIYSYPYWLAGIEPNGAIVLGALPQILGIIIEIVAIVKIAGHLQDRKWVGLREKIAIEAMELVKENIHIISGIEQWYKHAYIPVEVPSWSDLMLKRKSYFFDIHIRNIERFQVNRDRLEDTFYKRGFALNPDIGLSLAEFMTRYDRIIKECGLEPNSSISHIVTNTKKRNATGNSYDVENYSNMYDDLYAIPLLHAQKGLEGKRKELWIEYLKLHSAITGDVRNKKQRLNVDFKTPYFIARDGTIVKDIEDDKLKQDLLRPESVSSKTEN